MTGFVPTDRSRRAEARSRNADLYAGIQGARSLTARESAERKVICGVCGHAMQRDNKKNGSYRCVMKRLNTGFDCSEEKVPEVDILEAVIDTIQVYAQYAVSIYRLLQTRQEQRQLDRKQAQRQLQTLQSRKAQLDERLQDLYEGLVEGGISARASRCRRKS